MLLPRLADRIGPMRIVLTILASAVVGTAVGASLAYVQVYREGNIPPPSVDAAQARGDNPAAVATVEHATYEFGQMKRGTKKSHEFVVRNTGTKPLKLESGPTTCKCTLSEVPSEPVPPGGTAKVKLEWRALVPPGPFRQTAQILTNDIRHPRMELAVSGTVTEASGVWPPDAIFGRVRFGETKSVDVYIMSKLEPELEVHDPVFSDPATREHLAVQIEPVDRSQLPDPQAVAGVRLQLTVKPDMPLGRFDQWLSVTTNLDDASSLEIPISGRVIGGVSIYGRNWSEEQQVLRMGTVQSDEGGKAELHIVARDEVAAEMSAGATFEVVSCDPSELKAVIGKPNRISDDMVSTPVTIEVPPGTPPMVRLDTSQGEEGHIVLRSTLPDAPQLTINVRFAVQR